MSTPEENAEQIAYWNAATHWVDDQEGHDQMLAPLGLLAIDALDLQAGERVLDIGCGTGATTSELSSRVGPHGFVQGVDVSAPMLELARRDAGPGVSFLEGDAQTHPFGPASFDAAYSRFGVMFFSDPVAAFTNIRTALRPDGRLAFVCWQAPSAQEWVRVPLEACGLDPESMNGAGAEPFSLADRDVLERILLGAGFGRVEIGAAEAAVLVGGRGGPDAALRFMRSSRVGRFIREMGGEHAFEAVPSALAPLATPDGTVMGAAVWLVTAG